MNRYHAGSGRGAVAAIILVAVLTSTIRAELLYFAKGGRVQAAADVQGERVRVESPDGTIEFQRSDFRKIVPGHWPAREWPARREKTRAGDAATRYAAAWWALENGLTAEAEAMLRSIHADEPHHQPTARMVAVLDRLDRPCTDPDLDRFRAALGQTFDVVRSRRFVLFHQHPAGDATERIELLERVARSFYLLMASRGFELRVPPTRLLAAWFADQRDYQQFLRSSHAGAFLSTQGYFHPTFLAVVAFDARSASDQRARRDVLMTRQRELDALATRIDAMPVQGRVRVALHGEPTRTLGQTEARATLARARRDLARQQLLLDLERRSVDHGTAAHELVHQLVAASGLFRARADAPLWLHEGLAAQFEVVRGGQWAGISRAHDLRLPDWRAIRPVPALLPLLQDAGFGHGYDRDVYAASWALVYFLRHERPDAFVRFLDLLRAPAVAGAGGPDRWLHAFETAVGTDLASVERDWRSFLRSVQTPLEEFDLPEPERVSRAKSE